MLEKPATSSDCVEACNNNTQVPMHILQIIGTGSQPQQR